MLGISYFKYCDLLVPIFGADDDRHTIEGVLPGENKIL